MLLSRVPLVPQMSKEIRNNRPIGLFFKGILLVKPVNLEELVKEFISLVVCRIISALCHFSIQFAGFFVCKGICRKVLIFLLVGIGNIIDVAVLGAPGILRTAVIFFYLSNEGVSLLENAAHLGLPVPEAIKTVLEQLHDKSEKGE